MLFARLGHEFLPQLRPALLQQLGADRELAAGGEVAAAPGAQLGDHAEERAAVTAAGAYVMGRKMFASDQGEWDLDWHGWWGPNPPYHAPTFVVCHRPRASIEMEGGTVFHFVTEGIEAALERAREAAGEKDVSIAGGPSVLNQYLGAGAIDELRLHVSPFVAGGGGGERIFADVGDLELKPVSHLVYRR